MCVPFCVFLLFSVKIPLSEEGCISGAFLFLYLTPCRCLYLWSTGEFVTRYCIELLFFALTRGPVPDIIVFLPENSSLFCQRPFRHLWKEDRSHDEQLKVEIVYLADCILWSHELCPGEDLQLVGILARCKRYQSVGIKSLTVPVILMVSVFHIIKSFYSIVKLMVMFTIVYIT